MNHTSSAKQTNQYLIKCLTDDVLELKNDIKQIAEMLSYIKERIESNYEVIITPTEEEKKEDKGWLQSIIYHN